MINSLHILISIIFIDIFPNKNLNVNKVVEVSRLLKAVEAFQLDHRSGERENIYHSPLSQHSLPRIRPRAMVISQA